MDDQGRGGNDPEAPDDLDDSVLVEIAAHLVPRPEGAAAAATDAWQQEKVAPERRYEVGELLGAGGVGTVHRAVDRVLGRAVALKFLRDDDARRLARFQREARAQARIEHPNICRVYEVGELAGRPFIAMQLVKGKTLAALGGELGRDEKVQILRDIALAVQAAHEAGFLHRDLKPSNILVERDAQGAWKPYVTDFGIAQEAREPCEPGLTATGEVLGTPQYMAPEQALGRKGAVSERSDVYALGATLYHALLGAPPWTGDSARDVLFKVVEGEVVPPRRRDATIPVALETIVLRCLSKVPEARYASARALADDLGRYLAGVRLEARRPGVLARLRKTARVHAVIAVALVVALLALATGLRVGWWRTDGSEAMLFALSIDDAAPRPLGARVGGVLRDFAVAPDGHELALQVLRGGRSVITVLSLEDGGQRILGDGDGDGILPRYSADGQEIFWVAPFSNHLVAVRPATNDRRVVDLPGRVLAMIPGAEDLHLFVLTNAGKREQWDVPGDGTALRQVAPAGGYAFHVPITRSGWQLAWRNGPKEPPYVLPPGAATEERLDGFAGVDAQERLWYVHQGEVRVRELATGKETVVLRLPTEYAGRRGLPRVSRDGRTLFYLLREKVRHEWAGR